MLTLLLVEEVGKGVTELLALPLEEGVTEVV